MVLDGDSMNQHSCGMTWRFYQDKSGKTQILGLQGQVQWSFQRIFFSGRIWTYYGYGSIPINTIFSGMNIHLPAILMFTRGTRFWPTAMSDFLFFMFGPNKIKGWWPRIFFVFPQCQRVNNPMSMDPQPDPLIDHFMDQLLTSATVSDVSAPWCYGILWMYSHHSFNVGDVIIMFQT